MILVDANLLLYAEDSQAARHAGARDWWDAQLSGDDPVCLCWTVLTAFVRIGTNPRVYARPLSVEEAVERIEVRWPGGGVEAFAVDGVDRLATLREGAGIPVVPSEPGE